MIRIISYTYPRVYTIDAMTEVTSLNFIRPNNVCTYYRVFVFQNNNITHAYTYVLGTRGFSIIIQNEYIIIY